MMLQLLGDAIACIEKCRDLAYVVKRLNFTNHRRLRYALLHGNGNLSRKQFQSAIRDVI